MGYGRDSILTFGGVIDCAGSNSPNEKMAVPDAIATYCLPSTAYEIGDAVSFSPVWKCQRCFPFRPSSPTRCPSSSPKNTTPPAVDTVPAHESALPVIGYSHLRSPVLGSNARRKNCPTSCGLGPAPPPEKFPLGVGSLEELVYTSPCSRVTTWSRPMAGLQDADIQSLS